MLLFPITQDHRAVIVRSRGSFLLLRDGFSPLDCPFAAVPVKTLNAARLLFLAGLLVSLRPVSRVFSPRGG